MKKNIMFIIFYTLIGMLKYYFYTIEESIIHINDLWISYQNINAWSGCVWFIGYFYLVIMISYNLYEELNDLNIRNKTRTKHLFKSMIKMLLESGVYFILSIIIQFIVCLIFNHILPVTIQLNLFIPYYLHIVKLVLIITFIGMLADYLLFSVLVNCMIIILSVCTHSLLFLPIVRDFLSMTSNCIVDICCLGCLIVSLYYYYIKRDFT